MRSDFGENVDINEALYRVLKVAPQLKPSDARLLLMDTYETVFGIFNHEVGQAERDIAVAGYHPVEDSHSDSLLYERIEQFGSKQVPKHFGLSLTEFLEYPRDLSLKILEECERLAKKESADTENALNKLGGNKP